ncbi:acyltransferase family protein [Salinispora pacifica]|uniref:acyltransferase family protein n=1 Tax=Salinispora pacifica TaxID=351187 RepID=UPI00037C1231|nr:acyltransferase [Salinispora pacifica]
MSQPRAGGVVPVNGTSCRLPSLTGLRWWAALLVFGEHYRAMRLGSDLGAGTTELSWSDRILTTLFGTGYIGVSCFFILSGFVLAWSARPGDRATAFWRRRFAKIYPVFAMTTFLAVLLLTASGNPPALDLLLVQSVLLQAWVPDQAYSFGLNPVTWSLSAEAFFYLCFPTVLAILLGARTRILRAVVIGCVVYTAVVPWLASRAFQLRGPTTEVVDTAEAGGSFLYWFTYVFPVTRLAEFVAGVAAAVLLRRGRWIGPGVPAALCIVAAGFVVNLHLPGHLQREAGMFIPFLLLITALATADLTYAWSPMRSRRWQFLGEVSFALYAIQLLVIVATGTYLRDWLWHAGLTDSPTSGVAWWLNAALFFVYLVVCVLAAWLLHRSVELPMMRVLAPRRRAPATAIAAPDAREVVPVQAGGRG